MNHMAAQNQEKQQAKPAEILIAVRMSRNMLRKMKAGRTRTIFVMTCCIR